MKCGVFKYFCKIFIIISVVLLSSCDDRIREVDELYNSLFAKLDNVSGEFCGHKYVDLGLPSGLMWATYNVGTTNPKESGNYFSWDENAQNTKNYNNLTLTNDIARSKWGGGWRMPTISEFEELSDYCKFIFVDYQGYKGVFVVSSINGNSIFMPTIDASGESGSYWSSSYYEDSKAYFAEVTDNGVLCNYVIDIRYTLCVRAVCKDTENIPSSYTVSFKTNGGVGEMTSLKVWSDDAYTMYLPSCTFTREGYYFIGWSTCADGTGALFNAGEGVYIEGGNITFYAQWSSLGDEGTHNGHEYVDLGLPSGIKWATCSVGAESPEDYGDYFAWGETSPKSKYTWDTYKYSRGSWDELTKYCDDSDCGYNGYTDSKTTLDLIDDAARANWGGIWRMPTINEYKELITYCTFNWTSLNGVKGYKVTSVSNGNSIFLPAADFRAGTPVSSSSVNSKGDYWSSSLSSDDYPYNACHLGFNSYGRVDWYNDRRDLGYTVRAVFQ